MCLGFAGYDFSFCLFPFFSLFLRLSSWHCGWLELVYSVHSEDSMAVWQYGIAWLCLVEESEGKASRRSDDTLVPLVHHGPTFFSRKRPNIHDTKSNIITSPASQSIMVNLYYMTQRVAVQFVKSTNEQFTRSTPRIESIYPSLQRDLVVIVRITVLKLVQPLSNRLRFRTSFSIINLLAPS